MIVIKKSLSRRTVLRGMGASLALPLLDGMIPAFAAQRASAARATPRLCVTYVPNGINMPKWTPAVEGTLELTPILEPLAPFRDRVTIVSGLASAPAMPQGGEGTGDHVRASAAFLSGTHPKKTEGPDIRAGVSMDQLAAAVLGKETPLSSLELCLDSNDLIGACESGWSCAYANTLSWRTPTTPLPMENDPRLVFERLFGDVDNTTPAARVARASRNRSLLDSLVPEVNRLQSRLGAGDRRKVDQYLEAVREIEQRIQKTEAHSTRELPPLEKPMGIPATYEEHAKLMFDLQVLAFQTDTTRISTFMLSREVSPRTYPELGISDPHHGLSHHGNNPDKIALLTKVNTFHVKLLSYFLEKLQATPDGDGTLLDHITLLYGCCISDGNQHLHTNLPILIAGGGAGSIKGGRHVRYKEQTPLTNLGLTLLDKLGVPLDSLGDSTGKVDL
jgi:hypothetical protein